MRYLLLLITGFSFIACNTKHEKKTSTAPQLTEASIYNKDSVLYVVETNKATNPESDKQFLSAIDTYRNKKEAGKSIPLFKKSVMLQPQAKAYYELGNALFDTHKYEEAITAYGIAEALNYKPLSKVMYNTACAYSLLENDTSAMYYLVSAIEYGYANAQNIFKDPDLAFARKNYEFESIVRSALSGASDPDKLQWSLFSREFKPLAFPVTFDMSYSNNLSEDHTISYDYEKYVAEMRDDKFSRDVGMQFYYVGIVKNSDSIRTIVYAGRDEVYGEDIKPEDIPTTYYIASFDNKGKLVDKLLIGGHKKLKEPLKVPTIKEDNIQITLLNVTYEKDPDEEGFVNNKIKSKDEIGKEQYSIGKDGKFVKQG